MGRVVVSEHVAPDRVTEDPGGGDRAAFGGWSLQFLNEEAAKLTFAELFASDAKTFGACVALLHCEPLRA